MTPERTHPRLALLAVLLLLAAGVGGCGGPATRDVRVTILDEEGNPLPGAVFYAEAYDAGGAYAFLAAEAGQAGEVPDSVREPLKMPWRRGARIALAAFHPGRRPAVLRDPSGRIESDGAVLMLVPASPGRAWEPALASLAYPFENEPELRLRVAAPGHEALRAAFREAYAPLSAFRAFRDRALAPAEIRKAQALDALE